MSILNGNRNKPVVAILDKAGQVHGGGLLLDDSFVLTAAHVVGLSVRNKGRPLPKLEEITDFEVRVFIPSSRETTFTATIVFWNPNNNFAVLKFISNPKISPLQTPISTSTRLAGHTAAAFGFPNGIRRDGGWAQTKIAGASGGAVRLDPSTFTHEYSGSPVWDDVLDAVVGLLGEFDESGAGIDSLISMAQIAEYWTGLDSYLMHDEDPPAADEEAADDGSGDDQAQLATGAESSSEILRTQLLTDALDSSAVADQPVTHLRQDRLGFENYVLALKCFIDSKDTTTPLTISIDGPWGVGKSSLMRMLCSELDRAGHQTTWFNSWKFDQEEQIWAALTLAVLDQLREKVDKWGRFKFWFHLTRKRFSFWGAAWQFLKKALLPLALCIAAIMYGLAIGDPNIASLFTPPAVQILQLGQPLLWLGAAITALNQISNIIKDPFQFQTEDFLDQPDYKEKIGFIGRLEKDFQRIVDVATIDPESGERVRKLVVFIDDLDRCEPPKAADIIEAINLFLDSEGCVFILGMDSTAVIASIETKYNDLFSAVRRENVMIVSPGRLFLDKIIQIPFQVPRPTSSSIATLVEEILHPVEDPIGDSSPVLLQDGPVRIAIPADSQLDLEDPPPDEAAAPPPQDPPPDVASYANKDVQEAIRFGASLLPENPRQVKRFINLFRLTVYIADVRRLFEEQLRGGQAEGITLKIMAVWVAWSIRWPALSKHLTEETALKGIREHFLSLSRKIDDRGVWKEGFPVALMSEVYEIREQPQMLQKAHWSHLPWEWWLQENDFRIAIKQLEIMWPMPAKDERDWLITLLSMTSLTVPPLAAESPAEIGVVESIIPPIPHTANAG
jgi:hypothetical protein